MSLRILHLEDDPKDTELVQALLQAAGIDCHLVRVETEAEFTAALAGSRFDLILSDFTLPTFRGHSAFSLALESCPTVPFIFVSGTIGEDVAIESLKSGATDYVLKQKLSRLVPAVRRALDEAEERRKRKQAEDMLRAALEGLPSGVLIADSEGKILFLNPKLLELFGYTAEELISQPVEILVPQRYRAKHVELRASFLTHPQARPMGAGRDLLGVRKNGSEFAIEIGLNPVEVGAKQVILASIVDITERRKREQALRQSEERFRELAENISEIFFVSGPSGSPVYYVSPAYEQITGATCDSLYENPRAWLEGIHTDDRPRIEQALKDKPERLDEEYRVSRPDGAVRSLRSRAFPVKDDMGNVVRIVGITEDITERKAAEARLQLQSAALEAAANGIVITDTQGTILWVNSAFTALTGYSAEEAVGANPRILKSETHEPSFYADLWTTIWSGKVWHGEMINRRKDGTLYTEEQTITPVMDSSGKILHFIAIKQDISRRKAAEAASERNLMRIRALHEIDLAIMSTLDLHSVLYVLLENTNRFLPYYSASTVQLLNKESGLLEPTACHNLRLEEWRVATSRLEHDFGWEVIKKQAPLLITNLQTDPRTRHITLFREQGLVSYAGVPLIAKGEPLGLLAYLTKNAHQFTSEEVEFLQTLAGQAAIAIHNAQLYEQTKKQSGDLSVANENLQRRERIQALLKEINQGSVTLDLNSLLQKLTDRVREFMQVDISDVRMMQPDGLRPIAASGATLAELQGRREGVSDRRTWYLKNRRPLAIPDIKTNRETETSSITTLNIRGYLGAPLFSRGGDLIGVLRALSYHPREFNQEEIDLAEQLARGAATAIENSRLYEELKTTNTKLREREEIQRLLKELSQDITTTDLANSLQKLTDKVRDFLRVDICDIRVIEAATTRVMAVSGIAPERLRSTPGRGQNRLRTYTETREPIRVSDLDKDPGRFVKESTAFQLGIRGYLGAPFFANNGQFLGIMRALTYQPRDFSQEEADLLQQLANGAAIAIDNRRLYQDLEKSNKVKTEFLGVMSHELRTPLNVIMGYTTMMSEEILGEMKPQQKDALQKVTRQSKNLLAMVESIMEATQIESESVVEEKQEVNLTNFLSDLRSSYDLPSEKDVSVLWDYPADLPVIKTDRFKLAHILQNLIDNAIKFTEQGSVTVSARVVERDEQRAESTAQGAQGRQGDKETRRKGGERKAESGETSALTSAPGALRFVEFRVSDTGIGIAEKDLPIIFDMFRQVDSSDTRLYGGVGLGLYIVKKLTDLLGGTVAVESEPGKGCTFTLRVPLEHPPA